MIHQVNQSENNIKFIESAHLNRGFINPGRLIIRKRNSCASALISLSDVQPPSVYKTHISNGQINKLNISLALCAFQLIY